jgi:hypothetical protein
MVTNMEGHLKNISTTSSITRLLRFKNGVPMQPFLSIPSSHALFSKSGESKRPKITHW